MVELREARMRHIVEILMALVVLLILGFRFAGSDRGAPYFVLAGLALMNIVLAYREGLHSSDDLEAHTPTYRRYVPLFWVTATMLYIIAELVAA